MAKANTIASTEARFVDGSVVTYRDADPLHIRQSRFQFIMDNDPVEFTVFIEGGARFGVDLASGDFIAEYQRYKPVTPPQTPLRLIYYKRMNGDVDPRYSQVAVMEYFVVGWQTTAGGKNVRYGLKVWPDEARFELSEDI
jgi:hypothetical protein